MYIEVLHTSIVSLSPKKYIKIFLEHLKLPSEIPSEVDK